MQVSLRVARLLRKAARRMETMSAPPVEGQNGASSGASSSQPEATTKTGLDEAPKGASSAVPSAPEPEVEANTAPDGVPRTEEPPEEDPRMTDPPAPFESGEFEAERWNDEWRRYLGREWRHQLKPHTAYEGTPELPEAALDVLEARIGDSPLHLYCQPVDLLGKRVMEMGCGCGNLGKLLGRYVESYLGVDYSPMALMIARLVSPSNCTYIQVAQKDELERYFATIDTVVGRWFWIHQNMKLARVNLEFLSRFLKTGGHLYADFRWPDLQQKQFKVFAPSDPLSAKYPSATFRYTEGDVDELIKGLPFRIMSQEIHTERQSRFVRFERI